MSEFEPLKIDIISFFESDAILRIKTLSPTQKVILKIINGETLDTFFRIPIMHPMQEREFENEVDLFLWLSGKDHYEPGVTYLDVSLCCGRRGGKSLVIGAGLIIYRATQKNYREKLGTSPHATVPIISPTKAQANEVYQAVKRFFLQSPYLFEMFLGGSIESFQEEYDEKATEENRFIGAQIKLTNRVVIKTMTADVSNIRGFSCPLWLADEVSFFGNESSDLKNSDRGIIEAITPATAQYGDDAFGLKISSPNGESGLMYDDYLNRKESHVLHIQAPTWMMNPTISMKFLERERKKGEHYFNREFGAQYTSSENSYLDPKLVEACVITGIDRLSYNPDYQYVATTDMATKHDLWTFSIGHKEFHFREILDNGKRVLEKYHTIVADLLVHWQGSQGAELDPKTVIAEIAEYMYEFRIQSLTADQYSFAALRNLLEQHGLTAREYKMSLQSKRKLFYSMQVAINSGTFKYVNNSTATNHLKGLRQKQSSNGVVKIEAAAGSHDDYASAISLLIYHYDSTSPLYLGHDVPEDEEIKVITKDENGKALTLPSFDDLSEMLGNPFLNRNLESLKEKEKAALKKGPKANPEDSRKEGLTDEDNDAFWFIV